MTRTTIDIDPALMRELKRRKEREGKTLGALVSELLAQAMHAPEPAPGALEWSSKPMRALVDISDEEALRRALDRPA